MDNFPALNANRRLAISQKKQASAAEKLSTGLKINWAADDAAGLAISEKMRAQIRGLDQGTRNVQDGMSMINVADGILGRVTDMVQRVRELSVQAASDSNETKIDRAAIQQEIDQLVKEIDTTTKNAEFNTIKLFDSSHIGKIIYAPIQYVTITPMDPAYIFADLPFESVEVRGGTNVDYSTPSNAALDGSASYLNTLNSTTNFPLEGIFAIQVRDPDRGTYNVVLDFAIENNDGNFTLADFKDYFHTAFNSHPDGKGPIAEIDITPSGQINVKTLGTGGANASVHIGVNSYSTLTASGSVIYPSGKVVPPNPVFVNSSIFGTEKEVVPQQKSISVGALSQNDIAVLEAAGNGAAALDTYLPDAGTTLWDLLSDSAAITYRMQERGKDQYGNWLNFWSSSSYTTLHTETFTKGDAKASGYTTAADFISYVSSQPGNQYFASYSTSVSWSLDRDGNTYVTLGTGATTQSSYSSTPPYYWSRQTDSNDPFSNITGYSPASFYHNAKTGPLSITSEYPAKISEEIGILDITVGNIPGLGTQTAHIDFSTMTFTSLENTADPFDPNTLVGQINLQLNATQPNPMPTYTHGNYDPNFPIAKATINSSGRLVITAGERQFDVEVTENMSDRPMFSRSYYSQYGSDFTNTLTITGNPGASVNIKPGNYSNIDEFISANAGSFQPHYILGKSNDGTKIVITSTAKGDPITVSDIKLTVSPSDPTYDIAEVFKKFGFATPTYQNGKTHPSYQEALPQEIEWMQMLPIKLWIQSGANTGDGLYLELPHMNANILGLLGNPDPPPEAAGLGRGESFLTRDKKIEDHEINVLSHERASTAITRADTAINIISEERAKLGATSNRLEQKISINENSSINLATAESRIRDADMAKEMVAFTKENIQAQAATAILAQANTLPQNVLQLLK